ncbi:MAG TPA: hypothetical protein VKF41_12610 [Bryobacteraceae bacterium]|nr:hypothetical protein [Bryobacteraceae bacterium]
MIYKSEWWSVELPAHWSGYPDAGCSTFRAEPSLGVLQISAVRKDTGIVTEEDLREFAEERIAPGLRLERVWFDALSGLMANYRRDGLHWQEWWLRSGPLMVYVTYNVSQEYAAAEQVAISSILCSLAKVTD